MITQKDHHLAYNHFLSSFVHMLRIEMKVSCFNRLLGSISGVYDKFFNTLLELELDHALV